MGEFLKRLGAVLGFGFGRQTESMLQARRALEERIRNLDIHDADIRAEFSDYSTKYRPSNPQLRQLTTLLTKHRPLLATSMFPPVTQDIS